MICDKFHPFIFKSLMFLVAACLTVCHVVFCDATSRECRSQTFSYLQTLTDVCCSSDVQMFLKFSCKSLWHVKKMSKLNLTLCLQRNDYYLEWKHHSQNPVRKTSTQYWPTYNNKTYCLQFFSSTFLWMKPFFLHYSICCTCLQAIKQ